MTAEPTFITSLSVSVLVLTKNEERNLARCLGALGAFSEIVVLDSGSTDRTVEIARLHGARVYERPFDNFAGQRNWALDHLDWKNEWILHLDADEVVTSDLCDEIQEVVSAGSHVAYRIPSKTMFRGHWLRYSGMYPTYQVRLGMRSKLRFIQNGHGQIERPDTGPLGTLEAAFLHYSFSHGLHHWFEKHNRYSTDEAAKESSAGSMTLASALHGVFSSGASGRHRSLKFIFSRFPFRPALRFIYMYFVRLGFLDGRAGLTYCYLLAIYEFMIVAKRRERREGGA